MNSFYSRHRRSLLTTTIVVVFTIAVGSLVSASLSENINVSYTPGTDSPEPPTLATVVEVGSPSDNLPVILTGEVINTGGSTITRRGFVWGLTSYGDPGNTALEDTDYGFLWIEEGEFGLGEFSYQLPDLTLDTDYYGRAFASNSVGWSYGNEVTFGSLSEDVPGVYGLAAALPYVFVGICLTGALALAVTGFGIGTIILVAIATIISIVGVGVIQGVLGSI